MGEHLHRRLGGAYRAGGFTFQEGHYSAYGPDLRFEVHPGYPGTHEHVLAQSDLDVFLLPLAGLPEDHVLHRVLGFRYLGSAPQELTQFYPHRLSDHFDVVGFVRHTDSTRYLVEPVF